MNHQRPNPALPPHPFFETVNNPPNLTDCINAIDRAYSMIALCETLKLDEEEGGLSPDAALGFYWVTVLTRSALSYVSARLVALDRENERRCKQTSAYLSALCRSLTTIGPEHRGHLLNHMATRLNVSRSEVDQFIEGMAVA
ncbi:MAG: hypothetical protein ABW170_17585 [Candidatus Thiodiazotropha sp. L084R]